MMEVFKDQDKREKITQFMSEKNIEVTLIDPKEALSNLIQEKFSPQMFSPRKSSIAGPPPKRLNSAVRSKSRSSVV